MPVIYLFNTFSMTRMSKFKVKIPMFVKLGPWTTLYIHMLLKSFDHKFPLIKYLWNQYVSSALSVHVVLKQTFWYIYINNAVFLLVFIKNGFWWRYIFENWREMDMYEVKSKSLWLNGSLFLTTQKQNAFSCVEKLDRGERKLDVGIVLGSKFSPFVWLI